eukprot:4898934-Alexandrium_andersonii.AAC.1
MSASIGRSPWMWWYMSATGELNSAATAPGQPNASAATLHAPMPAHSSRWPLAALGSRIAMMAPCSMRSKCILPATMRHPQMLHSCPGV